MPMKPISQEQEYLYRITQGDKPAIEQLYNEHFPVIRGMVCNRGGVEEDAKDVFQDAVLVLYLKAKEPGFRLTSSVGTYFFSICKNIWYNTIARKGFSNEISFDDDYSAIEDGYSLEEALLYLERGRIFWNAFHQLGEDCRELLELFFRKEPMTDIARKMGFSSAVYARRRKLQCKRHLLILVKKDPAYRELL